MENQRKTFVFNTAWYRIIRNCSVTVKGEVFSAVMEYFESGKIIEMSNEASVIFQFIRREIDRRESRRLKSIASNATKSVKEIVQIPSDTSDVLEYSEVPAVLDNTEAIKHPENTETMPPTTTLPMTRQMRIKLKRQGIILPGNPKQA